MPRAMEPIEQVDPRSYIGLAFKHLGGKDKCAYHQSNSLSNDSSGNSASTTRQKTIQEVMGKTNSHK